MNSKRHSLHAVELSQIVLTPPGQHPPVRSINLTVSLCLGGPGKRRDAGHHVVSCRNMHRC